MRRSPVRGAKEAVPRRAVPGRRRRMRRPRPATPISTADTAPPAGACPAPAFPHRPARPYWVLAAVRRRARIATTHAQRPSAERSVHAGSGSARRSRRILWWAHIRQATILRAGLPARCRLALHALSAAAAQGAGRLSQSAPFPLASSSPPVYRTAKAGVPCCMPPAVVHSVRLDTYTVERARDHPRRPVGHMRDRHLALAAVRLHGCS